MGASIEMRIRLLEDADRDALLGLYAHCQAAVLRARRSGDPSLASRSGSPPA